MAKIPNHSSRAELSSFFANDYRTTGSEILTAVVLKIA
jgi:hypothetical protein